MWSVPGTTEVQRGGEADKKASWMPLRGAYDSAGTLWAAAVGVLVPKDLDQVWSLDTHSPGNEDLEAGGGDGRPFQAPAGEMMNREEPCRQPILETRLRFQWGWLADSPRAIPG